MEEKIQSVQYRDSEPSEFAHKPPKQEMDLSCFPGQLSPIGSPHRLDSVELGVIHIVASSYEIHERRPCPCPGAPSVEPVALAA